MLLDFGRGFACQPFDDIYERPEKKTKYWKTRKLGKTSLKIVRLLSLDFAGK